MKNKCMRLEKDIESLEKSATIKAEEAEKKGMLTLLAKSNALSILLQAKQKLCPALKVCSRRNQQFIEVYFNSSEFEQVCLFCSCLLMYFKTRTSIRMCFIKVTFNI